MEIFGVYPEIFSRAGERQNNIMNKNDSNPFYLFFSLAALIITISASDYIQNFSRII